MISGIQLQLKFRVLLSSIALSALGALSNANSFEAFPGLGISLASVFTIYAAISFGPIIGAFVATASFIPTLYLWEQPLALISSLFEATALGILHQRYKLTAFASYFLYWIFIGTPIIFIGATYIADLAWPIPLLLLIKYPLNSLLCLLVALTLARIRCIQNFSGSENYNQPQYLGQFLFSNYAASIFLPSVVLVTVAGFITINRTGQIQSDTVKAMSTETARDLSVTLDFLERSISTLAVDLPRREPRERNDLLVQYLHSYPIFSNILVADGSGQIIHSITNANGAPDVEVTPNLPNITNTAGFSNPKRTGKPFMSDAFALDGNAKNLVCTISAPLYDPKRNFFGVIEGVIPLKSLPLLSELVSSDPTYQFRLFDRKFYAVASNADNGPALMTNMRNYAELKFGRALDSEAKLYEVQSKDNGRRELYLGYLSTVPNYGWYVLRERSVRSVISMATESFAYGLFWASIACTVAISAAQLISRRLTTPFKAVLDGKPIPELRETPIELAELSVALSDLSTARENAIAELKKAVKDRDEADLELKRFSKDLEMKIMARTAELAIERDRAAELSRTKSDFIANVSHEFRTPLNVILGNVQLMQWEQKLPSGTGKIEKRLNQISASCELLRRQVDDILDLAKIEAKAMDLDLRSFHLSTLVEECLSTMHTLALMKSIELSYKCEDSVGEIIADRHRLTQIMVNLISNAIKFTHRGGQVKVSLMNSTQDNDTILVEVSDNGAGLTEEEKVRMFVPFTRGCSASVTGESGTGLGLPLVRQLVGLHEGKISVVSEIQKGSCFTVALPKGGPSRIIKHSLDKVTTNISKTDTSESVDNRTNIDQIKLILIAEDHQPNAELIEEILNLEGFRTKIATNGVEAVRMAKEYSPSLILMDWRMPLLSGAEAVKQIRKEPRTAKTPIVALTGVPAHSSLENPAESGANKYLTKPIDGEMLIATVYSFLKVNRDFK